MKVAWKRQESIFKLSNTENSEYLSKCFEFDFTNCNLAGKLQNLSDGAEMRALVKTNYKMFYDAFRHYCA